METRRIQYAMNCRVRQSMTIGIAQYDAVLKVFECSSALHREQVICIEACLYIQTTASTPLGSSVLDCCAPEPFTMRSLVM
jgi:hypothetical protein